MHTINLALISGVHNFKILLLLVCSLLLQIIQNRAACIIGGAPWDTSSTIVLDQLNWKPLSHRHQYNVSIWIYKILNILVPPYLSTISSFSNNKYNFRQSKNNVFIPQPKTNFKKRSLLYRGTII